MPRIFDNMNQSLLPELKKTLVGANRADFCVGYINLRGWKTLEQEIEKFVGGEDLALVSSNWRLESLQYKRFNKAGEFGVSPPKLILFQ
jgi:hypothetical protein